MTAKNIGILIEPNILKKKVATVIAVEDVMSKMAELAAQQGAVVESLLRNYSQIFE